MAESSTNGRIDEHGDSMTHTDMNFLVAAMCILNLKPRIDMLVVTHKLTGNGVGLDIFSCPESSILVIT